MSKLKGKENPNNNFNTGEKEEIQRPITKRRIALSKVKRRILRHIWLVRIGLLIGFLLGVYLIIIVTGAVIRKTGAGFYFDLAKDFIFTPSTKIESLEGRTNILILGKGGGGHEAPDLTDTIIFASITHKNSSVALISLSRDIWIPELRAKLNSAYYWGNQKQKDGGLILAKSEVEKIVGAPVHYGVVVDFSGFKKIIDVLGGIEVDVERSFTDKKYPIPGRENDDCGGNDSEYLCRYETIQFEKGKQIMDGETALKFARSRNAEGDEGTDFARAARQEKVLETIKKKALSRQILLSPKKIINLINVVLESLETDIDPSAAAILARRVLEARDDVYSHVLPESLLENPPKSPRYDNLYIFIPKEDPSTAPSKGGQAGQAWDEVHKWVECVLENGECE